MMHSLNARAGDSMKSTSTIDFQRKIAARHPSPPVLTLKELNEFLSQAPERYRVAWLD